MLVPRDRNHRRFVVGIHCGDYSDWARPFSRVSCQVWLDGYAPSDVIALNDSVLYVAGDLPNYNANSGDAFVTVLGKSSSLIFFGVNPPVSFGILGALIIVATTCILWFRRRWKNRRRPPRIDARLRSLKIPADVSLSC